MAHLRERPGPSGRAQSILRVMARCRLDSRRREEIDRLLSFPVDWTLLLSAARREGLSGLVRRHCADPLLSGRVPPAVRADLDSVYYATAARTTRLLADARALCAALDARRIPVILLKGGFLGSAIYGNVGLRPIQDVDLLVPREAMAEIGEICAAAGYAPDRDTGGDPALLSESPFRNTVMFRREEAGNSLFLHLHWHLVNASYPLEVVMRRIDLGALWSASRPWSFDGTPVRVLEPAHFLAHLAEHALKHCYEKLILLTDIAETVGACASALDHASSPARLSQWLGPDLRGDGPRFWTRVSNEVGRFGLTRPVAHALRFSEDLLGVELPLEAAPLRGLGPVWGTERWFARAIRADVRRGGVNWLAYLAMMDSWAERAHFLGRAVFPPPGELAKLDAVTDGISPFHYLHRFRQATSRCLSMAHALWAAR